LRGRTTEDGGQRSRWRSESSVLCRPSSVVAKTSQPACKPGSVRPALPFGRADVTAIPLGRSSPTVSSNQPGWQDLETGPSPCGLHHPYSVLLPAGLAVPLPLPEARCALTAPFHPYPRARPDSRSWVVEGGLLSVALSLGLPPPDVIRRRVSMEPGLSSADAAAVRPTGMAGIWGSQLSVNRQAIDNPGGGLTLHASEGCRIARLRRAAWDLHLDSRHPNPSNLIRVMPAKGLDVRSPSRPALGAKGRREVAA